MFLHVHRESISTLIPCKRYCRKDKTMSVQVLSSDYINRINPQQLDALVKQGVISKRGDKYVVPVGSSIDASCLVKDVDGKVKTFQLDSKGTVVERTTPEHKGVVVGEPQTTYNVSVNALVDKMGLNNEMKTKFNEFLAQKKIQVSEGGEISFNDVKSLNDTLKEFATAHKENFVDANAQKYVEFTDTSDEEAIDHLKKGDKPAIGSTPTTEGGRRYAVQDMDALKAGLSVQVGDTSFEDGNVKKSALSVGVTTTTTRKEGILEVPDGLHGDKSARKTLEKNARAAYADFVAKADPETRDAIDLYIAERKYDKQINKKMQELSTYTTNMGGSKERTVQRDGADIVQYYINNYADEADKAELNRTIDVISNSTEDADKSAILKELKGAKVLTTASSYDELSPELKRKGALLYVAKSCGYSPDTLLRLMATKEVMGNRTSDQILKDDQYFIKEQAKDFVKNKQAEQDVKNTTVFFSKEGRKNAPEDGNLHTDIGDKGRRLVQACPEMLCDEITKDKFNPNEDGAFEATMPDGTKKYFKFSSDKWQAFMGICCDPANATDEAMNILFGGDAKKKGTFLSDLNMTLQEGRSVMQMNLPSPYGESGTVTFESIIGKSDRKTSNKELNAVRHMVESAGYSVDSNSTAGKRLLHVLKNAGIGTGMGLLTGGLGSLLSGAVTIAGQTAGQVVGYSGQTADRTITTNHTFNYTVNGEDYSRTITDNIRVKGQEYSGEVGVDGQKYRDSGNNHWDNARNAGILGGAAGGIHGLATMGGVQERGRNVDDIFDLTRLTQDEDTVEKKINIEIPQFVEVQTRRGTIETGADTATKPAVKWRYLNAYNVLYDLPNGVSERDFVKAYRQALGLPAGVMPRDNKGHDIFVALNEITINGQKCTLKDDWESLYSTIQKGTPGGGRGQKVNIPSTRRTYSAQGRIK